MMYFQQISNFSDVMRGKNVQNLAEIDQLAFVDFKYFQKKNFDSPILKIF